MIGRSRSARRAGRRRSAGASAPVISIRLDDIAISSLPGVASWKTRVCRPGAFAEFGRYSALDWRLKAPVYGRSQPASFNDRDESGHTSEAIHFLHSLPRTIAPATPSFFPERTVISIMHFPRRGRSWPGAAHEVTLGPRHDDFTRNRKGLAAPWIRPRLKLFPNRHCEFGAVLQPVPLDETGLPLFRMLRPGAAKQPRAA